MIYILILIIISIISLYLVTLRKEKITESKNIMSYSSITIGNYFIKKHAEKGNLTPLKLLKIVYIAYGWYLAFKGIDEPLVSEKPQAWVNGPVFSNLYHNIKQFGKSAIKVPIRNILLDKAITDDDSKFLDKIWEIYGEKDGIYLSAITHTPETPWSETYPKGYNLEIPDKLILQHYKSKIKPKIQQV